MSEHDDRHDPGMEGGPARHGASKSLRDSGDVDAPVRPIGQDRNAIEERQRSHDQAEWEMDQLVALMGRYLAGLDTDDPRFVEWLEAGLRAQPVARKLASDEVRNARERILRRAAAGRSGVRLVDRAAPRRPARLTGRLEAVVEAAIRERCAPLIPQTVAAGAGRDLWEEECEYWVELPVDAQPGRFVALTVAGESMMPLFHPGDVVLVRLGPEAGRGSVVVARNTDDGCVVKRVGLVDGREIELVSLNPEFASVRVPCDGRSVVGTVVLRWCDHPPEMRVRTQQTR